MAFWIVLFILVCLWYSFSVSKLFEVSIVRILSTLFLSIFSLVILLLRITSNCVYCVCYLFSGRKKILFVLCFSPTIWFNSICQNDKRFIQTLHCLPEFEQWHRTFLLHHLNKSQRDRESERAKKSWNLLDALNAAYKILSMKMNWR